MRLVLAVMLAASSAAGSRATAGPAPEATPESAPAPVPEATRNAAIAAGERNSLLVVIVADQLPAGKLEQAAEHLTGGLGRFLAAGRRFTRCEHDHSATETGPGHATLLSGLRPRRTGIVANDWYDRAAHRPVNCVGGAGPDRPRNHDGSEPTTAEHLRGENLGDLIKRKSPGSRVWAVAGKDRSAILTAGHGPDGVFWYSRRTGGFTSNPRFVTQPPAWAGDLVSADPTTTEWYRSHVPPLWEHPVRPSGSPDDYPFENAAFSRVSPHPLNSFDPSLPRTAERIEVVTRRVFTSPWVDWLTLQLARRIVEHAGLGQDESPDLLVVGLSGLDAVGHSYGPESQEYLDTLVRVDGWLVDLMDEAVRRGRVLFALSADHGVLPLPETVPGGRRIDYEPLRARLEAALSRRLASGGDGPFIEAMPGSDVYLDRRTLERLGIPLDTAIEAARRELSGWAEVARVYRASDLSGSQITGIDPFLDRYRRAYDPERSGDLVLQPCEWCLLTSQPSGTSHGSPYDYDRKVPMILLGPGVAAGEDFTECRTVDLAPTLARQIGLEFDEPRDGQDLLSARVVDRPHSRK